MGTVHRIADGNEEKQTARFRWREEKFNFGLGYWVDDTDSGGPLSGFDSRFMGDCKTLFCEDESEGNECLQPGTQRFYDALNGYFENEQPRIALEYFGITLQEVGERHG